MRGMNTTYNVLLVVKIARKLFFSFFCLQSTAVPFASNDLRFAFEGRQRPERSGLSPVRFRSRYSTYLFDDLLFFESLHRTTDGSQFRKLEKLNPKIVEMR